jgi:hypothetical protein
LGVFSVTADGNACTGGFDPVTGDCLVGLSSLFQAYGPNTCWNPAINTGAPDWVCFGPQPGSPNPAAPIQTFGANPEATPPFNIFGTVPNLKTPRIQYYSATIQHELFRNNAITVSYLGAHGTDSFLNRSLNNRPIGCKGLTTGNCARPFDSVFQDSSGNPLYKYAIQLTNDGYSRYNALQATYRQRGWHGLNTMFNFTWSNCVDTNSVNRGGASTLPIEENPYNPRSNEGPCDTDVRLNFNTGVVYDFPRVHGLGRLGEGWQVGSIFTALTGRPWTALLASNANISGQDRVYERPDCTGAKPSYQFSDPGIPTITNFQSVFSIPADNTIGTCGRNAFRGPGFRQWDFNVVKNTKINERMSLQLRFEIFNLLNHPNFNSFPSSSTISASKLSDPDPTEVNFANYSQTPDIASGNPFLSQGGPRAGQIGLKLIF